VSNDFDTGDAQRVRDAVRNHLKVHVRIRDQGHAPDAQAREQLANSIPDLLAFDDKQFESVRVLLDWDHQIPSQFILMRVLACYDAKTRERVDAMLDERDDEIGEMNLYPEFDVADYGEIEGSETYVAVMRPGSIEFQDFRFLSAWRKNVSPKVADAAVKIVRGNDSYQRAAGSRRTDGLGGPVVIGWAPPCLAHTERWGIEIWLLTEFDGHTGKARVFMIDLDAEEVTREFDTDVQLA
jgi:hypothetical protein